MYKGRTIGPLIFCTWNFFSEKNFRPALAPPTGQSGKTRPKKHIVAAENTFNGLNTTFWPERGVKGVRLLTVDHNCSSGAGNQTQTSGFCQKPTAAEGILRCKSGVRPANMDSIVWKLEALEPQSRHLPVPQSVWRVNEAMTGYGGRTGSVIRVISPLYILGK